MTPMASSPSTEFLDCLASFPDFRLLYISKSFLHLCPPPMDSPQCPLSSVLPILSPSTANPELLPSILLERISYPCSCALAPCNYVHSLSPTCQPQRCTTWPQRSLSATSVASPLSRESVSGRPARSLSHLIQCQYNQVIISDSPSISAMNSSSQA